MLDKVKHLINLDEQRFVMVGGLMGAGKSTIVSNFEEVGYEVVCPDRIRHSLAQREAGNEGKFESELEDVLQKYSMLAFKIAEKKIKEHIAAGKSVIFDATNLNAKARKQVLGWGRDNNIAVIAVYVECPAELAVERNIRRSETIVGERDGEPIYGRYVPTYVIELKAKSQVLPTVREGFKEVYILHAHEDIVVLEDAKEKLCALQNADSIIDEMGKWKEKDLLKIILPTFDKAWGMDQENSHHKHLLHEHMINAATHLQKEDFPLFLAALIHDIGKPETKRFYGKMLVDTDMFKVGEKVEVTVHYNSKDVPNGYIGCKVLDYKGERRELLTNKHVEVDPDAHYYEHHVVGAVIARRELSYLGFEEELLNKVYDYVLYHMDMPFKTPYTDKAAQKLIDKVGEDNALAMLKLREADKLGSGAGEDYMNVHKHNVETFARLIGKGE